LPSCNPQRWIVPSLPPEAHKEPSGATVTVLIYPVCPVKFDFSLQFVKLQTFTTLSHPPDTIKGVPLPGETEKLTVLTHSVWPWSSIVYLHSPKVFQSLIVLSLLPDTICLLSPEKATLNTSLLCPTNLRAVVPVLRSQSLNVASQDPERANWPSDEITTSWTKWECPVRALFGKP